jgi:hypothetical protein
VLPWIAMTALCLLALPADAQWKWRDKDGQINASDRPPPRDIPEKDVLARPPLEVRRGVSAAAAQASAAGSAPALAKPALDRELEAKKRAAEQEQAAKVRADEERQVAQRAENCRRARSHLTALDGGQRMARVNDKGEREVLDDNARAEETRQAREVIASECR